jgi:cellulose synthase/poly-beta-1,6-N-acetylglucosamine synthase-like glycosyltransferase
MVYLFYTLVALVVFQLALPFLTVLSAQIVGRERRGNHTEVPAPRDYGCIITAYRNAAIAVPLVQSLLRQSHPHFHIYLVADNCPPDFDPGVSDARFTYLRPDPALHLKAKSIIYAMDRFVRPHQYTAIFDADNLAHPDFLAILDQYAAQGHYCIQGQRTAKNTDNRFAAADALGEHYKNYIERYAPYLLCSSSVISGSGMATETNLYRAYLDSPAIQEGQHQWKKMLQEDKILQNFLLLRGERIAYARHAICYDEKVETADAVQTQRSRWLFSYFQNVPNTRAILGKGLANFDWNRLFFGLVTLSLPMFIQLGVAFLLFLLGLWLAPMASLCLAVAVLVFAANLFWTLSLSGHPGLASKAMSAIPSFIGRQVMALLGMGNPNKNFKHTEHKRFVSVDEVLGEKDKKE